MKAGCCVSLALPQLTFIVNNLEVIVFMVQLSGYVYWGHIRFFYCFLQFFNGIRHGEKMYETLLTNEECAKAIDMGDFYRVPADNRGLNYDKYFKEGDEARNTLTEFNSNNTHRLNLQETIDTISELEYIQGRLAEDK